MIECPISGTFTCFPSLQDKTLVWKEKKNTFFLLRKTTSSLIYFLVNKNAHMKKGEYLLELMRGTDHLIIKSMCLIHS